MRISVRIWADLDDMFLTLAFSLGPLLLPFSSSPRLGGKRFGNPPQRRFVAMVYTQKAFYINIF